jgi:RNA 2',3'-cyclic 3'-phosphodiesterase
MALLGIQIPHETARILNQIEVPGNRESTDAYHITLLYLGDHVPIETVAQAVIAAYKVTSMTRPFTVRTRLVTSFPGGEDGVPIIAKIESDELHRFRADIASSFDAAAISYSKKFPEYKPHVTLAYSDSPMADQDIPMLEWGAHEIVLWAGEHGDQRMTVTFPFTLMPTAASPDRVAARFLSGGPR